MTNPDFLRGPWRALLIQDGRLLADASEIDSTNDGAIEIWIFPARVCLDDRPPHDDEDGIAIYDGWRVERAMARWAQAQAMAAGLNAAAAA